MPSSTAPNSSSNAKSTTQVANAGFSHLATPRADAASRVSPDFLVLVLDLNPLAWAASDAFDRALDAVIVFLNAHIAMQHENGIAVYAAGTSRAELLFTTAPFTKQQRGNSTPDANTYQHFKAIDDRVVQGIKRLARRMVNERPQVHSNAIVTALAQALCHLNRLALTDGDDSAAPPSFRSRILIISVSADASTQYIPMMNTIFAAQKKSIIIDVCKLLGKDTVFLQQAAHLTGGTYFRIESGTDGLLQSLLSAYLPSRSVRQLLYLPTMDDVDFRAACFCHRKIVDIGYVCSVCLSCECPQSSFPAVIFRFLCA